MTEHEYARALDELDRLLNDPDIPMDPSRVWSLLADLPLRATAPTDGAARPAAGPIGLPGRRAATRHPAPARMHPPLTGTVETKA